MRTIWTVAFLAGMATSSLADQSSPWFGSEASVPTQVVLEPAVSQLQPSYEVSTQITTQADNPDCATDSCSLGANIGK